MGFVAWTALGISLITDEVHEFPTPLKSILLTIILVKDGAHGSGLVVFSHQAKGLKFLMRDELPLYFSGQLLNTIVDGNLTCRCTEDAVDRRIGSQLGTARSLSTKSRRGIHT